MHTALIRPGGINASLNPAICQKILEFINQMRFKIDEAYRLFGDNPIWQNRLKDVGFISKRVVESFGLTGVLARGSGLRRDLRKTTPYDNYQIIYFNTPVDSKGDC